MMPTGNLQRMTPARYIMVGGFLGAGKTTAILRMAEALDRGGRRVGLITNDQSVGLVDTTVLAAHGFPVEEITGGCFCCRFNSLVDAAERLAAGTRPDVFIAEPVGSCTDLRASVSYPLRRMYGDAYTVAPLSVVVDPVRALRVLGLEPGRSFSPKVLYVYRKQLEEAELIVINKIDAIEPARVAVLREALTREYPAARIFEVSARTGQGMDAWIDVLTHDEAAGDADLDIDYATYGEGEALLGWVNCTHRLAGADFDGNAFVHDVAARIAGTLSVAGTEIAHLKMTLTPAGGDGDLAVLNQVRTEQRAELSHALDGELSRGELIVNLRAEGDPARLAAAVDTAILDAADAQSLVVSLVHSEHFRPGQPNPTHRLAPVVGRQRRHVVARPLLPLRLRPGRAPAGQAGRAARADRSRRRLRRRRRSVRDVGAQGPGAEGVRGLRAADAGRLLSAGAALDVQRGRGAARRVEGAGAEHAGGDGRTDRRRAGRRRAAHARRGAGCRRTGARRGAGPMSASITARSPLLVVLYEGAGAMPLEAEARFEITRALLEKGYRIITTRAGRGGTTPGERQVLVLGRFTGEPPAEAVAGTGAAVHFRSLDGVAPADVVALVEGVGGDAQTQKPGGWKPWFPVIDYTRCTNCMQCLSFCLFDVYGVSTDKQDPGAEPEQLQDRLPGLLARLPGSGDHVPEVPARPDQRRRGERRRHPAREAMKVDISALLGGDIYAALRDRSAKAKSRFSKERDDERALKERQNCLIKLQAAARHPGGGARARCRRRTRSAPRPKRRGAPRR